VPSFCTRLGSVRTATSVRCCSVTGSVTLFRARVRATTAAVGERHCFLLRKVAAGQRPLFDVAWYSAGLWPLL